jgi:hypothetical protein
MSASISLAGNPRKDWPGILPSSIGVTLIPTAQENNGRAFRTSDSIFKERNMCAGDPAARCARVVHEPCPSFRQRVWGTPDARCTRGLVCTCKCRKHTSNNEYPGITRRSRTQWFYDLFRALPGDRAVLPPSSHGCPMHPNPVGRLHLRKT